MDETTSVPCTKEIFVDLLLDEIFKRVSTIFAENTSKEGDVLSLQTSFRSNFCNIFQSNIRVITDGTAPSVSESKYSQNLQDILEKETKDVVSKRKTYPDEIKKRLALELVQEKNDLLSDVRLELPEPLGSFTSTQDSELEVRQAGAAAFSVVNSKKRLQALRREEADVQNFVSLINSGSTGSFRAKKRPPKVLDEFGRPCVW